MRNLLKFIFRYNAFFLFLIFFSYSLSLVIKNNSYQHSQTVNSAYKWIGYVYAKVNFANYYLNLGKSNDSLSAENALLKQQILNSSLLDTQKNKLVVDTNTLKQFEYIPARVIKNSINLRNNVITLDKGSLDGIRAGMAVIPTGKGVVGFVKDVNAHFSTVVSLLNKDAKISAMLEKNNVFGSVIWGDGNYNYRTGILSEIPNNIKVSKGDLVLTSPYSAFPSRIPIGKVIKTGIGNNGSFTNTQIVLFCDYSTLQNVYVVKNNLSKEQQELEEKDGKLNRKK